MNKKTMVFIYSILGIILLVYLYSKFEVKDIFATFTHFSFKIFLFYIVSVLMIDFLLALRWKLVLNSYGIKISMFRLFFYRLGAYAIGFMTPQMHIGDSSTRLFWLKKHGVSLKNGLTTVLIDRALTMSIDGFFAFCGMMLVALYFTLPQQIEIGLILASILIISLLIVFYYRMLSNKTFLVPLYKMLKLDKIKMLKPVKRELSDVEHNMYLFFAKNKIMFVKTWIVNIFIWIFMFLEYKFALMLFGQNAGFIAIFLIIAFVGITYMLPIPFAVGVLEAGQLSILILLGISPVIAISLSLLVRTKDIFRSGIGIASLSLFGVTFSLKEKK